MQGTPASSQIIWLEERVKKQEDKINELLALRAADEAQKMPTKICGPNLVEILNSAGFYKKAEWVGLTDEELLNAYGWYEKVEKNRFWDDTNPMLEKAKQDMLVGLRKVEAKLKDKNT